MEFTNFFGSGGNRTDGAKKTRRKFNLFRFNGTGCAFCLPRAEKCGVFLSGGFVNASSAFFSQPGKRCFLENQCGKLTVFHILHRLFHSRLSTIPQPCGKRIDVDIKYLQFDTEFFTFPENGQFAPVNRFVENYPLDKKSGCSSAAGKDG